MCSIAATGEAGACRQVQTAEDAVEETWYQVNKYHEEQLGSMDLKKAVLYCRHLFPIVNRNHCHRDICLCVFSLDSIVK